jgi:uncharacterized protein YidB (DUF937 family)
MGLLDSVIGALGASQGGGGGGGNQAALLQMVLGMLMQGGQGGAAQGGGGLGGALGGMLGGALGGGQAGGQGGGLGGLGALLGQLSNHGLGDVAKSWVGTGQNLPISPDQITQVLGSDRISQMAEQLGMGHGDLAGQLSQMLPQVVDKLTPHGQVPQGNDLSSLGDIGGLLGDLLKR